MGKEVTVTVETKELILNYFVCLFVCVSAGSLMLGKNTVTKYIFSSVILQ